MKGTIYCLWLGFIAVWLTIPMNSHADAILSVRGTVTGADGAFVDGLEITVTNSTKNLSQTGVTGESGTGVYSVLFIDFFGSAVDIGDEISVAVKQDAQVVAEASHIITTEDLEQSAAVINVQLEEKAATPTLTRIEPPNGVITGGITVQIVGENLQVGATVIIGENAATEVTFISPTELTVRVPEGVAGSVDVVLTNPDGGSVSLENGFTYTQLPPIATGINPASSPVTGGTGVTITGENFQAGAVVRFGENEATEVVFVSATELTVTAPASEAGATVVRVINPDGQEVTLPTPFTYSLLPPVLTSITPDTDTVAGGTSVTLIGENFQAGATLTIGGNAATEVTFVSSTELTARVPGGIAGDANVVVTNPDGGSVSLESGFTYMQLPPIATGIDPASSAVTGGAVVTITGENFQERPTVRFGENEATEVIFVSATELTVIAPAGEAGAAVVKVINPDGQEVILPTPFTYALLPPVITSITPDNDTTTGGASVTLRGENFQSAASVAFGGNEATDIVVSDTEITATVPAGEAGVATVTITNPDGQSEQIEFRYTEFPPWDTDQSGAVNIFDLVIVASQFGQSGPELSGDVDRNGTVNIFDLVVVSSHFGEASVPTAPSLDYPVATPEVAKRMYLRPPELGPGTSLRLRTALTELANLSKTHPEIGFAVDLLRQWLIDNRAIPQKTRVLPNYPNPFNPETWMPYQLREATEVRISIYNVVGQRVRELAVGFRHAGIYHSRSEAAYWDGRNDAGERVTSGSYFYMLEAGSFTATRKIIVLK